MTLRLYDLAGAQPERRFSPYCWRIRLALAHKNLPVETIPWRFTEKAEIAASGQTLVPVLVDGDRWIADSWTIANYLEDTFPDSPSLFGGASGRDLTRYYSSLADSLGAAIFPFVRIASIFARVARSGSAKRWKPWSPTVTRVCLHSAPPSHRCASP
jgi:glutathione S-transferase